MPDVCVMSCTLTKPIVLQLRTVFSLLRAGMENCRALAAHFVAEQPQLVIVRAAGGFVLGVRLTVFGSLNPQLPVTEKLSPTVGSTAGRRA